MRTNAPQPVGGAAASWVAVLHVQAAVRGDRLALRLGFARRAHTRDPHATADLCAPDAGKLEGAHRERREHVRRAVAVSVQVVHRELREVRLVLSDDGHGHVQLTRSRQRGL